MALAGTRRSHVRRRWSSSRSASRRVVVSVLEDVVGVSQRLAGLPRRGGRLRGRVGNLGGRRGRRSAPSSSTTTSSRSPSTPSRSAIPVSCSASSCSCSWGSSWASSRRCSAPGPRWRWPVSGRRGRCSASPESSRPRESTEQALGQIADVLRTEAGMQRVWIGFGSEPSKERLALGHLPGSAAPGGHPGPHSSAEARG